ncbi:unnamed protein product [Closterium sp. NIES-64]|nr:unnamed protein product [Closterium sp. NIES-64]
MPPTTLARLCAVVLALLSVLMTARAQPLAGPRCVNRFPQKPLCKFVDDLAASPLTFLDASAGETIKLGAYDVYQASKFHRDLPDTKVYAYGVSRSSARYPGPVLVAKRGTTTKVSATAPARREQRGLHVVHKHGGETPSKSDGHPMAWYTAFGEHGPEFESEENTYPNTQRATMLWYHDHTIGITALNMAAGMAGLYVIRDPQGEERRLKKWLPRGERQLHLVIADRMFFPNGSINYPNQGFVPNVHPNWIPGYVGNTNVVNGKVWPFLSVRRAMHRIRMVNAANARTYNLTFQCAGRGDHNFNPPLAGPVLPFYLIGSHGGYLTRPLRRSFLLIVPGTRHDLFLDFNAAPPVAYPKTSIGSDGGYLARPLRRSSLLVVPGTRHDLLLDFNAAPGWCRSVIVVNSASIPFPVGGPADWFTGVVMRFIINQRSPVKPPALPKSLSPADWFAGVVMRIIFDQRSRVNPPALNKPTALLRSLLALPNKLPHVPPVDLSQSVKQRWLTIVFLWHIINPTFETHPIHLHLIQHRPISRRPINSGGLINGTCSLAPSSPFKPSCFTGPARPVPQHERGWKDTTVAWPDSVLTIFVPFKGQDGKPFPFDATKGPGYVWHCHAMEHEDNDMMRPLIMTS